MPITILIGAAACAGASGGASGVEPVCREGVVRVSGTEPFTDLAVVSEDGARIEIARDATELAALSGATVRLCATATPVSGPADVAAFDVVAVEGVAAVLGTVAGQRLTESSTGTTLGVRASTSVLEELDGACVWVTGTVENGAIALASWGRAPESVCVLARGGARRGAGGGGVPVG